MTELHLGGRRGADDTLIGDNQAPRIDDKPGRVLGWRPQRDDTVLPLSCQKRRVRV